MSGLTRLGLRLAGEGGAPGHTRALMSVLAAAVGCWLLMVVFAIAESERELQPQLFEAAEMQRVLAAVVVAIALPVIILVATASRLSASIRDRRLASLRLLGLTAQQTRLVAAIEAGTTATVGALLGCGAFYLTSPLVRQVRVAGRDWSTTDFVPPPPITLGVILAVPLVTVLVAVIPTLGRQSTVLARAHQAYDRRPSWWRVVPLGMGLLGLGWFTYSRRVSGGYRGDSVDTEPSSLDFAALFVGVSLTGLGVVLLVPIFVRLVADGMLKLSTRPVVLIAGRRLQATPAATTRVVAGLLLGLFLVAGARCVVGVFEAQSSYRAADDMLHGRHEVAVSVPSGTDTGELRQRIEAVPQVRGVVQLDKLHQRPCSRRGSCLEAFVGRCSDLATMGYKVTGCSDDAIAWLGTPDLDSLAAGTSSSVTLRPQKWRAGDAQLTIDVPTAAIDIAELPPFPAVDGIFIPSDMPGVANLKYRSDPPLYVAAEGADAAEAVHSVVTAIAPQGFAYSPTRVEDYRFVQGMRAMVWAVAVVVMTVGLLSFALMAIDGALARRSQVVGLQMLGVRRRTLQAAQLVEALLPLAIGVPLAVGLGWAAGASYLSIDPAVTSPWRSEVLLAFVGLAGALFCATLSVIGASPRIRPEFIRRP